MGGNVGSPVEKLMSAVPVPVGLVSNVKLEIGNGATVLVTRVLLLPGAVPATELEFLKGYEVELQDPGSIVETLVPEP